VKSLLIFADGRRVNLASAIDPETYAELEGTQGRGSQKAPLLFCGGCHGGVYVKHGSARRDELFGAHFDAGDCAETLAIRKSVMSDEHKRMAEYHVAAAQAEGLAADTEVPTSGRTRVDVVVDGRIGLEVQLSKLTAGAAVRRTGRSMAAGLELVAWCAERAPAAWAGKVPGYQWIDNGQLLEGTPRPQSVKSRGLYTFRAEHWAGRWTPMLEPLTLLVDEAVVRMAAGTIRPVMWGGNVQLMRVDGIALFEEMTGRKLAPFAGIAPVRALSPAAETPCARPRIPRRHDLPLDAEFWCEVCGAQHPLREHRKCRQEANRSEGAKWRLRVYVNSASNPRRNASAPTRTVACTRSTPARACRPGPRAWKCCALPSVPPRPRTLPLTTGSASPAPRTGA
jgi:hypothetical protein